MKSYADETWKYLISHNLVHFVQKLFDAEFQSKIKNPWKLSDPSKHIDLGASHLKKYILLELLK